MKGIKIMRVLIVLSLMTLLAGCAGDPVKTHMYLLRSEVVTSNTEKIDTTQIRLNPVKVANYIDQSGMVLQTADGEVNVARYHVWAEPLKHGLTSFLANQITLDSGQYVHVSRLASDKSQRQQIDVFVDQLHGTANGSAVLSAIWTVSEKGKERRTYRYSKSLPLTTSGYNALVIAYKQMLSELSGEIAQSLEKT